MAARHMYQMEISHKGLNKYRVVKAATRYELNQKTASIMAQWDEQWEKQVERNKKIKSDEDSLTYANEMTQQAEKMQSALDEILLNSLNPQGLDFDLLKDFSIFSESRPEPPSLLEISAAPQLSDEKYNPKPSFFTKLFRKKMAEFIKNNAFEYEKDSNSWKKAKRKNDELIKEYNDLLSNWETRRSEYEQRQEEENKKIDLFFEQYRAGEIESVERYFVLLLGRIEFPFSFDRIIDVEYDPSGRTLVVDMLLPVVDDIPNQKSISFIKSKKEFKETYYPESYMKKKYDNVLYQIVLQTLHHVFSLSSECAPIDSVVVNGKINTIDKATGKSIEPYILSVSMARKVFEEVNLRAVDPKAWFKSAKGVSAASLANVTPVAPIVMMTREDKRFIEGYTVSDGLDDSVNLAGIDWQDFENLIREIFEKEFNAGGGEVKITQASRDGGVDAVAFDPDPIRGGKIVIQAKRYTNVVGVSAVRDLYGTVLNEGATKGILVTTSNYGNDAYSFAQGKPITLMNGANLLYLLEKHGFKAKIDLKKAKEFLRG